MPVDKALKSLYRADPDAVWKETVSHEIKAKMKWEEEWGFLVDEYKKCYLDSPVEDVIKTEEKTEKDMPPYPVTTSKNIGWLSGKKEYNYEKFGEVKKPIRTLYKTFDWPIEACP